jgi:hypothetical protein
VARRALRPGYARWKVLKVNFGFEKSGFRVAISMTKAQSTIATKAPTPINDDPIDV